MARSAADIERELAALEQKIKQFQQQWASANDKAPFSSNYYDIYSEFRSLIRDLNTAQIDRVFPQLDDIFQKQKQIDLRCVVYGPHVDIADKYYNQLELIMADKFDKEDYPITEADLDEFVKIYNLAVRHYELAKKGEEGYQKDQLIDSRLPLLGTMLIDEGSDFINSKKLFKQKETKTKLKQKLQKFQPVPEYISFEEREKLEAEREKLRQEQHAKTVAELPKNITALEDLIRKYRDEFDGAPEKRFQLGNYFKILNAFSKILPLMSTQQIAQMVRHIHGYLKIIKVAEPDKYLTNSPHIEVANAYYDRLEQICKIILTKDPKAAPLEPKINALRQFVEVYNAAVQEYELGRWSAMDASADQIKDSALPALLERLMKMRESFFGFPFVIENTVKATLDAALARPQQIEDKLKYYAEVMDKITTGCASLLEQPSWKQAVDKYESAFAKYKEARIQLLGCSFSAWTALDDQMRYYREQLVIFGKQLKQDTTQLPSVKSAEFIRNIGAEIAAAGQAVKARKDFLYEQWGKKVDEQRAKEEKQQQDDRDHKVLVPRYEETRAKILQHLEESPNEMYSRTLRDLVLNLVKDFKQLQFLETLHVVRLGDLPTPMGLASSLESNKSNAARQVKDKIKVLTQPIAPGSAAATAQFGAISHSSGPQAERATMPVQAATPESKQQGPAKRIPVGGKGTPS